ncbi:MAG TPA: hypothetical protein PLD96_05580, partial [Methanothrix sp.]|nr:hypothetical protein [Methanothrix sp.]
EAGYGPASSRRKTRIRILRVNQDFTLEPMGYWRTNIFPHRYAAAEVLFVQAILATIRRDGL